MQGSLLGIRGTIEGFTTFELSVVMSAYFAGFLVGSQMIPGMLRRENDAPACCVELTCAGSDGVIHSAHSTPGR